MKKILSISVALLMLLSGMQLTISRHYCGGELADAKASFMGHIASCGMESETDDCAQTGNHVESSCCNNQVSVYMVDHNFAPSFTNFKAFEQPVLQVFILPEIQNFNAITAYNRFYTDVSPPPNWLVSDVILSDIGVFRI
ncbi:MAG TPA: hypothetical protein PKO30_14980 [Prolixibacteraceae bacterium]|nr:hypothetical protein [Prolixibacteraceae bacterium]